MAKETYVDKLKMQIGQASAKVKADNYFPLIGDTVTMNAETEWGQTSEWQLNTGNGTTTEDGNLTKQKDSHQVTVGGDGELQQKFIVENYLTEAEVSKTLYAMQPQTLPYFDIETTEVSRVGDSFTLRTVPENGYALACTGVCRIYKENETENPAKTLTLSPGTGTSVLETTVSFSEASERGIYDVEVDVTDTASGVTLSKRVNKLITIVPKLCPKPADTSTGYEVASTYKAQTSYSEGEVLEFEIRLWRNVNGSGLNYAEMILPRGGEENSGWNAPVDISGLPAGTTLCLKKDPYEPEPYPFRFLPTGNTDPNSTYENGTKNFTYASPLVVTHDCEDIFDWKWKNYGAVNVSGNMHNVVLDGYGYHNTGIRFNVFDERQFYNSCFFLTNGTSDWEMFGCDIDGAGFAGIMAKSDPNPNNPWYWRDNGYEFKNLRVHHCTIQNTNGEGVYWGYYSSGKMTGNNSAGSSVEYYAHLMRDIRLYRCHFYRTGLDSVQINNGVGVEVCYCDIQESAAYGSSQQEYGFSCTFDGKVYNCNIIGCNGTAMLIGPFMDGIKIFNNVIEAARFKGALQYSLWISSENQFADSDGNGEVDLTYEIFNNIIKGYSIGSFNCDYGSTPGFKMCDNVIITETGNTNIPSLFTGAGNKFVKAWFEYDSIDAQLKVADSANSNYQTAHNSPLVTSGEAGMSPFDMRGYKNWYKTLCHCGPFMGKYKDIALKDKSISVNPSEVLIPIDGSKMEANVTSSDVWKVGDGESTIPWNEGEGNIYLDYDGQASGTLGISSDENTGMARAQVLQLATTGNGQNDSTELTVRQDGRLLPSYITIDQRYTEGVDPVISGDINGSAIQWIRENSHCFVAKNTAEGKVSVCKLKDNSRKQYHNGEDSSDDIRQFDVFMKLPIFYYKSNMTDTDVWEIGFSRYKEDETWKEYDGKDIIGVYEGALVGSKYRSVSGMGPTGSHTYNEFSQFAKDRGAGYSLVKWKHHSMMAFLFYALYGTTDSQNVCGKGPSGDGNVSGKSDGLCMTDTTADTATEMGCVNFWGLENWWGNKQELVDGVTVNNRIWNITNDDGTSREIQGCLNTGTIKKIHIGEWLDALPTSVTGNKNEGYYDYYQQTNLNGCVLRRSGNSNSDDNGIAYVLANTDPAAVKFGQIGSRLAFRGEIEEIEDVETFKSLEEI